MIRAALGWICFVALLLAFTYSGTYLVASEQRKIEATACYMAGGKGKSLYNRGIPVGYHCQRMHLVLKYKNGVYK